MFVLPYNPAVPSSPDSGTQQASHAPVDPPRPRRVVSPVEAARRAAWGKEWGAITQQAAIDARKESG